MTNMVLARERGIDPAELWDEATRTAQQAARYPSRAGHRRHVTEVRGITVAELQV